MDFIEILYRVFLLVNFFFLVCRGENDCFVEINSKRFNGLVRSFPNGLSYCSYTNIPYALKPLRFERAQLRHIDEKLKRNFDKEPKKCIQVTEYYTHISGKEDCLYLHIYTPLNSTVGNSLLPVFVYLHGGSFNRGSPKEDITEFDGLLKEKIIVITINYRLGLFGFISLPSIERNLGLKDQQIALKWIQEYVGNFGGDRNQVTLGGWSAGGASVSYHLYAKTSKNLFKRAIIMSGTLLNPWALNVRLDRCSANLCAKLDVTNCTISQLQSMPIEKLIPYFSLDLFFHHLGNMFSCFIPTIEQDTDSSFISEFPYVLIRHRPVNDVPCIIGTTSLEETCDTDFDIEYSMQNYAFPFPVNNSSSIHEFYRNISGVLKRYETPQNVVRLRRNADMLYGIFKFTDAYADIAKSPVYMYRFASSYTTGSHHRMCAPNEDGALHGDDIKFIFGDNVIGAEHDLYAIRKQVTSLWIDFIKFGNPTPTNESERISDPAILWPPYNTINKTILNINHKLSIRKRKSTRMAAFWEKFQQCIQLLDCNDFVDLLVAYYKDRV